jgi:prevent-host-death family protein
MQSYLQVADLMRSIVPVSRFNKGEAAKIFDEVEQTGIKIVVKNNKPACVLFSPQRYDELMEEIDNLRLIIEAENRI